MYICPCALKKRFSFYLGLIEFDKTWIIICVLVLAFDKLIPQDFGREKHRHKKANKTVQYSIDFTPIRVLTVLIRKARRIHEFAPNAF